MVRKQVAVVVRTVLTNYASCSCTPNIYCTGCLQKPAGGSYLEVFVSLLSFILFLYESANYRRIICLGLPENIVSSLYDHSFFSIFHGCTMLGARSATQRKLSTRKQLRNLEALSSSVLCLVHIFVCKRKSALITQKILGAPYKFYICKQMCLSVTFQNIAPHMLSSSVFFGVHMVKFVHIVEI
jgi:hypothetical protein